MRKVFIKLVGIVVTTLVLAGPASALDMCFQVKPSVIGTPYLFVTKNYKKPAPSKCRTLAGYEASTAIPYPATGTACLNASSTTLYVYWNVVLNIGPVLNFSAKTELPYPSLASGSTTVVSASSSGVHTDGTSSGSAAYPCSPAPLP